MNSEMNRYALIWGLPSFFKLMKDSWRAQGVRGFSVFFALVSEGIRQDAWSTTPDVKKQQYKIVQGSFHILYFVFDSTLYNIKHWLYELACVVLRSENIVDYSQFLEKHPC